MGIKFDEGVSCGGKYGPYRQSERKEIYKQYVKQLLDTNLAYVAFDSEHWMKSVRKRQFFNTMHLLNVPVCNSLTLSKGGQYTHQQRRTLCGKN